MYEGKAPQLAETKAARMPAFFEHAMSTSPNTLSIGLDLSKFSVNWRTSFRPILVPDNI